MRVISLLIILAACSAGPGLLAQNLERANSVPPIGTVETRQLHTMSSPPIWSTTGTGNVWVASEVVITGTPVVTSYQNVTLSPHGSLHTTSNLCASSTQSGTTSWYYWDVTDALSNWVGVDGEVISGGRTVCEYPFSIGDMITDTYIMFGSTNTFTMEYVASGSIQAPFGTINDVVMFSFNEGAYYELYRVGNVLRRIGVYVPGVQLEINDVEVSEVGLNELSMPTLLVGPLPANEEVLVQLPFTGEVALSLMDMSGREVMSWINTDPSVRLDLLGIASGSYVLLARYGSSGLASGRLLVAH